MAAGPKMLLAACCAPNRPGALCAPNIVLVVCAPKRPPPVGVVPPKPNGLLAAA